MCVAYLLAWLPFCPRFQFSGTWNCPIQKFELNADALKVAVSWEPRLHSSCSGIICPLLQSPFSFSSNDLSNSSFMLRLWWSSLVWQVTLYDICTAMLCCADITKGQWVHLRVRTIFLPHVDDSSKTKIHIEQFLQPLHSKHPFDNGDLKRNMRSLPIFWLNLTSEYFLNN